MSGIGGGYGRNVGRTRPDPLGRKKGSTPKGPSLTSSATDDDFYSSLAQMAGDNVDDEGDSSLSEADAKKMADSLAGMDDLDSDLFGSSLTKKNSPRTPVKTAPAKSASKPSTPKQAEKKVVEKPPAHEPVQTEVNKTNQPSVKQAAKSGKKFDIGKFDNLDFDEDDPLAGLLSDDEDSNSKPKPKPKKAIQKKHVKPDPELVKPDPEPIQHEPPPKQTSDIDRPRTSHGRGRGGSPDGTAVSSPPVTPERKGGRRSEAVSPDLSSASTEGRKAEAKPSKSLSPRGRRSAAKAKEAISFDSDDDLPGLDAGTPRDTSTPPSRGKGRKPKPEVDLFGDDGDDGLLGLDEDKPAAAKTSGFSELMGGRKDKEDPKKQKPKSLDDFMAKISTKPPEGKSAGKKALSPTSEESFQFGGYMPSAAATGPGRSRTGATRPDTAPGSGRRSVHFADDLGLDDDILGSSRPKTAPSRRSEGAAAKKQGADSVENSGSGGSFLDGLTSPRRNAGKRGLVDDSPSQQLSDKTKEQNIKPSGGGGGGSDWLGLGDDDTGLELPLSLPKPVKQVSSPAKPVTSPRNDRKVAEPEMDARPGSKSPEGTPARLRRQASKESDDFLKMLGITPDDEPAHEQKGSKLPWETGTRKGRQWQEQSSTDRGSLDLSSSGRLSPSTESQQKPKDANTSKTEQPQHRGRQDSMATATSSRQSSIDHAPVPQETHQQSQKTPSHEPAMQTPQGYHQTQGQAPPTQQPQGPQYSSEQTGRPTGPKPDYNLFQAPVAHSPQVPQQFQTQPPINQGMRQSPAMPASYAAPMTPSPGLYQDPRGLTVAPASSPSQAPQVTRPEWQMRAEYTAEKDANISRTEAEMAHLMRRLQEAENANRGRDVNDAGYIAQLEAKVRHLELERDQLQASLDSFKQRHQSELTNIETSNKAHVKTLEESYLRREARIKEETDLQISHYTERLRTMEEETAENQAAHARKIQLLEGRWTSENERLRDVHRKALEEARREHEDEMAHLRKLKEQEVSAATSAHAHTKSLQSLMQQVLNSTKDVNEMKFHIESTHKMGMEEREVAARVRDEYLTQMQERLVKQQAENEQERSRLQGLIAKMELHIREQTRQIDQDKWRMAQDESRIKALQGSLEDERRMTMEQLAAERVEVQRAREELLREQQRVTSQLQEERRGLSMERAHLSSTQREILTREKHKNESTIQAEADLEATAAGIKQDAAALGVRQAQLKQEEEKLAREKREFDRRRETYEEEKDRIGKLSLEVQRRSEEIGELCTEAARAREEGEEALALAERFRVETGNERAETENHLLILQEKERQLAEDRVAIAHERRLLEMDKRAGRCRQCVDRQTAPSTRTDYAISSSPGSFTVEHVNSPQSPLRGALTPDLLMNSLELKRTLRRWSNDKEKDEEFLEQETRFLSQLQTSRDSMRSRQSLTSSPAH